MTDADRWVVSKNACAYSTLMLSTVQPIASTADFLVDRVLFRDAMMIVIDKPAGIPVHLGPGGGPNLEQFFPALAFGLPRPPALAHRLDRDTSGCLILGRNRKGLAKLGRLFTAGRIEKVYWAVTTKTPPEESGRIDVPLKKVNRKDGWRMFADPGGQESVTDYRVLGRAGDLAWVEFRPRTGRTHQIRVHAAAIGCPILGDSIYGLPEPGVPLHLHAREVTVPLYPTREPVTVTAAPPPHMLTALANLGFTGT
jgi:tRNA pseudouridine32 synthase/23S rRNA pseudouridine746 synthase/23S rRNA pseudouridine1911/1915/1917 synthase